jgi:hypothetical protein
MNARDLLAAQLTTVGKYKYLDALMVEGINVFLKENKGKL